MISFMTSDSRERGTGEAVFTGRMCVPCSVSTRTVVVITRRGSSHSWQAKASPFGQRAPATRVPSVSRAQQFGQVMQI